jgi:hypothetical protein
MKTRPKFRGKYENDHISAWIIDGGGGRGRGADTFVLTFLIFEYVGETRCHLMLNPSWDARI